ncbi:PREDICTED: uncharacterized protein LOC109588213 [Amphimedon queenslandica]|nr:PREDICTED: uncharacterized protein LOC109588213 [Amphimedon queenslandica]|eukprot:XP_019859956.1 PREDICTED: uncharacterized protein LOC109588213 [Amphimedon queenslandica]
MKEKSQLKEELQSMKDISADTKSIQCDYWTKAELPFDGMVTLGKKVCLFNANSSHELELDECGLSLSLPDGLFSPVDSTVYEAAAQGLWGGDFEFPGGTHLISSVCYISVSPTVPELDKPVTVQLVHCAHLSSESQSEYLSFVVAEVQPGKQCGPFKFELLPGGSFSAESQTGTIELKSFSLVAIVMGVALVGVAGYAIRAFTRAPAMKCLALIYKKSFTDKAMISLAAIQNLGHLKKLIKEDSIGIQSLLGTQISSFQFQFSNDKPLEVKDFPLDTIDGWKISPFNPPLISKSSVVDYSSSSAEPPYIQVSVEPDEIDATNKISHTLSIDGIKTPSVTSTVPWNIKVSKNDLLSTSPLSVVPSLVAVTSMENVRPEDQQIQQTSLDPQLAVKAFRKQFGTLSKLLSVSSNRLAVAPELFSEGLITFDCYKNATEGSSKTEEEKSTGLMISLMSTISTQPELLTELINVLNRIEPFKLIATKLVEASYH